MKKMTFTVDESTARCLDRASQRLGMPKSHVVREAVRMYGEQLGRLTDDERNEKLRLFDERLAELPPRPRADIDAELGSVRSGRRGGGRRRGAKEGV